MTAEKLIEAFEKCAALARRDYGFDGLEPRRFDPKAYGGVRVDRDGTREECHEFYAHLLWMCAEGAQLVRAGRLEKAGRWLGFVQGAIWRDGIETIEGLKAMNRPDVTLELALGADVDLTADLTLQVIEGCLLKVSDLDQAASMDIRDRVRAELLPEQSTQVCTRCHGLSYCGPVCAACSQGADPGSGETC